MKYIQCVQNRNQNVTIKETIYAIKNAGFDGAFVQWYHKNSDISQQEQVNLCRELGLEIPFIHLSYDHINDIWRECVNGNNLVLKYKEDLDSCKLNQVDLVIMHLSSEYEISEPNMLGIKRFQEIVDYAEQLNIRIAFENTRLWGFLEYLFDNIKNSNIGICFDAGHCHCFFNDKFNWSYFRDKIWAIHLHDNFGSEDQHLLPFDGTLDWEMVQKDLKNSSYNGPVVLESLYNGEYLNMSLEEFYKLSLDRAKQININ